MRIGRYSGAAEPSSQRLGLGNSLVFPLWLALTTTGIGVLIVSVPDLWQRLTTACTAAGCQPGQPTAAGLAMLAQLGLSPRVYSVMVFAALLAVPVVIVALMGVLLWKKPGDRTVAALAFGGMTCSLLGAIGEAAAARPWLGPLEGAFG